ncbi:MAG TPA: substrate-binding domain-containing protein, partial [Casimicrobiaceae bacterium]|nr:substrate-binding domain-containing protein [Casimicrobiaceae bacterium]
MTSPIRIVSSMATRQVLSELVDAFKARSSHEVQLESDGGVEAARRVRTGEPFDAVVLAAEVIDQLAAEGRVVSGSRVDLVRSGVSMAVRSGDPRPDIGSADAVRRAVLAATSVGYSTGPSGDHVARLFERWGIAEAIRSRTVQAPPGVPVGTLVAQGKVGLGFQQLAELIHVEGIDVLG